MLNNNKDKLKKKEENSRHPDVSFLGTPENVKVTLINQSNFQLLDQLSSQIVELQWDTSRIVNSIFHEESNHKFTGFYSIFSVLFNFMKMNIFFNLEL